MHTFHFDLRHVQDTDQLSVCIGNTTVPLQRHTDETRLLGANSNSALSSLPAATVAQFSHFSALNVDSLPHDVVSWVRVVKPAAEGVHLQQVVQMTHHIPEEYLHAFYRSQFRIYRESLNTIRAFYRSNARRKAGVHSPKLHSLGLTALPQDDDQAIVMLLAAQYLVNDLETAASLVSHHPDLANVQPYTVGVVRHAHILPDPKVDPKQYNAIKLLQNAITAAGGNWSPVIPCTDTAGNQLKAEYDLLDKNGEGFKTGQPLYTYGLDQGVTNVLAAPIGRAKRTARDDIRLTNKTWTPLRGTTALETRSTLKPAMSTAIVSSGGPAYKWTVDEKTEHHGINVDAASIKIDDKGKFSINASNSYLRTLSTGYQLINENRGPIDGIEKLDTTISAVNCILGIPLTNFTDPTMLEFDLKDAPSVQLLFGSLGTSDWVNEVSTPGALFTGAWQYTVPIVLMVAQAGIKTTKTYNKIVNDPDLRKAAYAILFGIVGGAVPTAFALLNTKFLISALSNVGISFILQAGMKALGEWLMETVFESAILNQAAGPVGWALCAAAVLMDFEEMAITTVEVLSSPATVRVNVSRAIDVTLTLHPDPKHGEVGNPKTAVWPTIASAYEVTLQYKSGTNVVLKGNLPDTTSNTPLSLTFLDIAAGGQFKIIAGVYSPSGWLAGSWQSDWLTAKPNKDTTLDLGDHDITEQLVPLTPDTQYRYKEQIVYENNQFSWAVKQPSTITLAALHCEDNGTLCSLVGLTINNSAFQVGYAWRASGQSLKPDSSSSPVSPKQLFAVQSLSVLAHPDSRLITSTIGFTNQPQIAYAPFIADEKHINQTNFVLDPRNNNEMHLRQVQLQSKDGHTDFGFGDPNQLSWGRFPLKNVDALVVHPSNVVLACSFKDSKLMILPLPTKPSSDKDAPEALLVSGEGIREGLLMGPKALAVSVDGRILVLESTGRRVQSFDIKGNPVPSFTWQPTLFMLPTSANHSALDAGKLPEAFIEALVGSATTLDCTLDKSLVAELERGKFAPKDDPLILALSHQGVILSYDPEHMDDPTLSPTITILISGKSWAITDPRGQAWRLILDGDQILVYEIPCTYTITQQTVGEQWLVVDRFLGMAWHLTPSTSANDTTLVNVSLSYFPLNQKLVTAPTYLDMTVEAQGHIYVLFYIKDGSLAEHYYLDVYSPRGEFMFRSPDPSLTKTPQHVVAGRMTIDLFRNLYALTYETLHGPQGAPQPSVAQWTPTQPLFSLPLTAQPDFNQRNISAVVKAFAKYVKLSSQAFITVVNPEGSWSVQDGSTIYHVYRSGDALQVYAIQA